MVALVAVASSCWPSAGISHHDAEVPDHRSRQKYARCKLIIRSWPTALLLPFTLWPDYNTLADEVLSFCTFIGNFFPINMRVEGELRATLGDIYAGVRGSCVVFVFAFFC